MNKSAISNYYDYTTPFYNLFWHSKTNAIHYGFWESQTKNHFESLINANMYLAKKVKLSKNDLVLDAGCGIGGSTIWAAKNIGCQVIGITISDKQIVKAKKLARKNEVSSKTKFLKRSFLNTGFKDESFDVVWALESVCYAEDKNDFLKEAYRVLKKDGRLILADGLLKRNVASKREEKILNDFCVGLQLPNLAKFSDIEKSMKNIGFRKVEAEDVSKLVRRSGERLYKMCRIAYPISKVTTFLKITPNILTLNNLAGIRQLEGADAGMFCYGVFYGKK